MAIQKLKGIEHDNGVFITTECYASNSEMFKKINEIIDIVNALVEENNIHELQMKKPADPFAKQQNWIGKLCKFYKDGENKALKNVKQFEKFEIKIDFHKINKNIVISKLWTTYLGKQISPVQVADMIELIKVADKITKE